MIKKLSKRLKMFHKNKRKLNKKLRKFKLKNNNYKKH